MDNLDDNYKNSCDLAESLSEEILKDIFSKVSKKITKEIAEFDKKSLMFTIILFSTLIKKMSCKIEIVSTLENHNTPFLAKEIIDEICWFSLKGLESDLIQCKEEFIKNTIDSQILMDKIFGEINEQ